METDDKAKAASDPLAELVRQGGPVTPPIPAGA
jgi:hypothetical protein